MHKKMRELQVTLIVFFCLFSREGNKLEANIKSYCHLVLELKLRRIL